MLLALTLGLIDFTSYFLSVIQNAALSALLKKILLKHAKGKILFIIE
jgi:hypothetical protein